MNTFSLDKAITVPIRRRRKRWNSFWMVVGGWR